MTSPSTSSKQSAVAHNDRLWPQFRDAFSNPNDVGTFISVSDKFKAWLSSQKAYYTAARPHIIELIEIAQTTLMHAVGLRDQHRTTFRAQGYRDNIMCKAYIDLVSVVRQHGHMFEPRLKRRLDILIETVTDIPPTPPISPADKPSSHPPPPPAPTLQRFPPQVPSIPPITQAPVPPSVSHQPITSLPATNSISRLNMPLPALKQPPVLGSAAATAPTITPSTVNLSPAPISVPALTKKKRKKGATSKLDALFAEDVEWFNSTHKKEPIELNRQSEGPKPSIGTETQNVSTTVVHDAADDRQSEQPSGAFVSVTGTAKEEEAEIGLSLQPRRADTSTTKNGLASLQSAMEGVVNDLETGTEAPVLKDQVIVLDGKASSSTQEVVNGFQLLDQKIRVAENQPSAYSGDHPTIITTVLNAMADHERNMQTNGMERLRPSPGNSEDVEMANVSPTQSVVKTPTPFKQKDGSEPMDIETASESSSRTPENTDMQLDKPASVINVNGFVPQAQLGIARGEEITDTSGAYKQAQFDDTPDEGRIKDEDEEGHVENQLYEIAGESTPPLPIISPARTNFILSHATWPQAAPLPPANGDFSTTDGRSPSEERPSKRRRTASPSEHQVSFYSNGHATPPLDEFSLYHDPQLEHTETANVNMQDEQTDPLMRVLCIAQCSNMSFVFQVTSEQFAYLCGWKNREPEKGVLQDCLCLSLSCCTLKEFQTKQGPSEECLNLGAVISSCQVQWPSHGELVAEITSHNHPSELKRVHLSPPVMLDMRPDFTVDITSLVTEGENIIQFKLVGDLSKEPYLVCLLLHQPTRSQREEFLAQHHKFNEWRKLMDNICRPLEISSQLFLSPSTF